MRTRLTRLTPLIGLLMIAGACSSSAIQESGVDNNTSRVVDIDLTEFSIEATSLDFAPGETVEFNITNSGSVEHEFRLSNQDRVDEHIAGGHEDHEDMPMSSDEMASMDDEADHEDDEATDAVLLLAAGESGTLTFTFPSNTDDYTVAVCLIPGHYEAGMKADLQIEG